MKLERWQLVEKLYYAALECEPDRRALFLDQACVGDEDLRREVQSLLASEERAKSFLAAPALEVAAKEIGEEQAESSIGRTVSHYQILSLLGAGGMGEVYLAEDSRLGRKVALKLLPANFTADKDRVRRFEQEARAASALNHANIITIYDIGQAEGMHFIATEYIDGRTLRQLMLEQARLSAEEVLEIAVQVAQALAAAHAVGIVHRDIKPENIMLRRDGYAKVLDFGLAKLAEGQNLTDAPNAATRNGSLTHVGVVMGTVTYMSPEQARGIRVDARSDIFSLGAVIYEMVAGFTPFGGETASDVIASILRSEPMPPARNTPDVPAELKRIVMKALVKDREARYQAIKDMALDLKSLGQELEFKAKLARYDQPAPSVGLAAPAEGIRSGGQGATASESHLICPSCQTTNPRAAKFCLICGAALARRCSNCQANLPAGALFCTSCGQQMGSATSVDDTRHSRLAAAAPASLASKIRAAPQPAGERRVVTVLFADLSAFTSAGEQVDPEDWPAIMNRALDWFSSVIYQYEGTIARLLGNSLLAFFGAPIAHEDDPVRAVRAALKLLAAARKFAEEVLREQGVEFEVRIGLNTGPVVIGDVGSDLKYEYTVMGDTVSLATRAQTAAPPMTVLVTEGTCRFVEQVFECADFGPLEVKGRAEPVHVYEVRGSKTELGPVRGLAGLESPMVGRDAELAALLQLSATVRAGLGRVAVVIGEPGLGKTRLITEWKTASAKGGATGAPLQWAEGHCLSYGQGNAYRLLISLLRSLIGVPMSADEAETRTALLIRAGDLFGDTAIDVYPFLGHLLSLRLEGPELERVRPLNPQALQNQYLMGLRRLLQTLSARRPLGLILEDIHWADPSSTDLLIKLLPLASEAPLLFCFVTRPDRDAPGWKLVTTTRESMGARLTELTLHELSDADSQQLISNLLDIGSLPDETRTLILKKSEGNPFFVEEVIRMLIDRGAMIRSGEKLVAGKEITTVEIPDSLHGLLLGRIDRLPDEAKHTLRVASVIGRRFPMKVLEQLFK